MIPFLISLVTLMPVRWYLTQFISHFQGFIDGEPEWNFFVYLVKTVPLVVERMSWLWFLLALFIVNILNYPLLKWTQRRILKKDTNRDDLLTVASCFFIHTLFCIL
jgi:hypothetical protein